MEEKHRSHIKQNIEKLIRETEYRNLMDECCKSSLLTSQMRQNIEQDVLLNDVKDERREYEKHKHLFLKITKRGPDAYENLKLILKKLEMYQAEKILSELDHEYISLSKKKVNQFPRDDNKKISPDKKPLDDPPTSELEEEETLPDGEDKETAKPTFEIIKSTAIMEDTKIGTYPMIKKKNRGIFFMVNIIDFPVKVDRREGAEKDGEALLYLFQQFGFKTYPYKNLNSKDFLSKLTAVLQSKESEKTECFVMALMTHGNLDGHSAEIVSFSDGSHLHVHSIRDMFKDSNSPHLQNKPKIFIFPFCRGEDTDIVVSRKEQTESTSSKIARTQMSVCGLKDVLICYASSHGFKSHRDTDNGNWYIQDFCELMGKHAHDTDLERIVKQVQGEVGSRQTEKGALQTCCFENIGFNKLLYFNPGVWGIDDSDET